MQGITHTMVERYIESLEYSSLKQLATQLIEHPESAKFIHRCIDDWDRFYTFPVGEQQK